MVGWGTCKKCGEGMMRTNKVGTLAIRITCDKCGCNELIEKPVGWRYNYLVEMQKNE